MREEGERKKERLKRGPQKRPPPFTQRVPFLRPILLHSLLSFSLFREGQYFIDVRQRIFAVTICHQRANKMG